MDPETGHTRVRRSESEHYSRSFQNLSVQRKRVEDLRLAEANLQILSRLTDTKPTISKRAFDKDRLKTERYINSIANFKYKDLKPNKFMYA